MPVALMASLGCALHLILDALEDKWGNGVHLAAPFDWAHFSVGVWPTESTVTWLISLGGVIVIFLVHRLKTDAAMIHITWLRTIGMAGLIAFYAVIPMVFVDDVIASNSLYLGTLSQSSDRDGQLIEFDRSLVMVQGEDVVVESHTREVFTIVEPPEEIQSGSYSLKGRFVSKDRIQVTEWKSHSGLRDIASSIGLALIGAWFVAIVVLRCREESSSSA